MHIQNANRLETYVHLHTLTLRVGHPHKIYSDARHLTRKDTHTRTHTSSLHVL